MIEDDFGLVLGRPFGISPNEFAVLKEKSGALGEAEETPDPEGLNNLIFRIGQEGVRELLVGGKSFLGRDRIRTNTDDFNAPLGKLGVAVPQATGLGGATRGVGFGVKKDKKEPILSVGGKIDLLAFLVLCAESWNG